MSVPPSSSLADQRELSGYTQESFAERLGVDRTTVGRWERGVQAPQPWQRPDIAKALSVTLEALDDILRETRTRSRPSLRDATAIQQTDLIVSLPDERRQRLVNTSDGPQAPYRGTVLEEDLVHASIPRLRCALDSHDLPIDGPTRPLAQLAMGVDQMIEHRLEARYLEMAWTLPDLVAELSRAAHQSTGEHQLQANRLLTLAYRAADGMAYKYGYLDLSARIIDLMRSAALKAEDPLLLAAVAYVRTETFFATGDLDAAANALTKAADNLLHAGVAAVPAAAAYGALHMRAAVVAGRARRADTARDHLAVARRVAAQVPDDVYFGTAFGPSSVRIHDLAVAVELRDAGAAVERAGSWDPPRRLPAERRSHYYIELAGAQLDIGLHEDSYQSLELARQIAPQHTREHPGVKRSLAQLLRSHPSPSAGVLTLAAWARAR